METTTEATSAIFDRDGAITIPNLIKSAASTRIEDSFEMWVSIPEGRPTSVSGQSKSSMRTSMLFWPHLTADLASREIVNLLGSVASELLRSKPVRFFNLSLFDKEPHADVEVPWHQDLPYYPLKGSQMVTLWTSLDTADSSAGVPEYLIGSHKSELRIEPVRFRAHLNGEETSARTESVETLIASYPLHTWSVSRGDVLAHHGLTWHRSGHNKTQNSRRGLAMRFIGPDVDFDPAVGLTELPGIVDERLSDSWYPSTDLGWNN